MASGVRCVPTKGHTPWHQSLVVETDAGTTLFVLVGQAIYSRAELELIRRTGGAPTEDPPPDPQAYLASALSLIEMRPRASTKPISQGTTRVKVAEGVASRSAPPVTPLERPESWPG